MRKQSKQRRTAIYILALVTAFFGAKSAPARESSPVIHILVFGDSLSAGLMLKPAQAWPSLLVPKFRQAGLEAEIRNVSKSGDTTVGGLERIDRRLSAKMDIFVLELGINDVFRATPVAQIQANLQQIIDRVKRAHPNVRLVICGMKWPGPAPDLYVEQFGQMYRDLAVKNHAALVPFLLEGVIGNQALNLPDGFHPNAAGHEILAENVWRVLEPVAREVAANVSSPSSQTASEASKPH